MMLRKLILLCALPALSVSAQTTKVLFIGNSYTYSNDLPNTFRLLALSLGDTVSTAMSAPGGYTFQGHTSLAGTQQLIAQGAWDHVVLQEQSQLPSFSIGQVQSDCFPYAAQLVDSVRSHAPCAEPVFFMTWGRQNGDAANCANWPPVCTFEGMNALLRERYLMMAVDNSASCAPAGMAWKHTRDQQPGINLYTADGSHPSPEGTYLAACTFYATIFRRSPVGAAYLAAIDPSNAAALQGIAASTVLDSLSTWNIGVSDADAAFTSNSSGATVSFVPANAAGTHTWIFGDGTSDNSTVTSPTYAQSGVYDVMHILTDPCGRVDTVTNAVNVVISSVDPGSTETQKAFNQMVVSDGKLWYTADRDGMMDVYAVNGQSVAHGRIATLQLWSYPLDLPANTVLLWRFTATDGNVRKGRMLVP